MATPLQEFRLPSWELKYMGEAKRFVLPAGYPGAAVSVAARRDLGTMTDALRVRRWTPAGLFDFAVARTLDMTVDGADSVLLDADDLQGCTVLAVENPVQQTGVIVDLVVTVEPHPGG